MDSWLDLVGKEFAEHGFSGVLNLVLMTAVVYLYLDGKAARKECHNVTMEMVEKRTEDSKETTKALQMQAQLSATISMALDNANRTADARTAATQQQVQEFIHLRDGLVVEHQRTRDMIAELRRELSRAG